MPNDRGRRLLLMALGAMFLQQSFASVGRNLPAVIAPAIMSDLGIDPAWLGVYVGLGAIAALLFQLGCGAFILRYGALRVSQAALVMLGLGLAAGAAGPLAFFAISAMIGGGGSAISTPASSHLLGRYSPPQRAPLVFSIKQTAVPAGLLVGGLLGPWMVAEWGWRGALLAAAAASIVFAVMLQPLRAEFDQDRGTGPGFRLTDFWTTLRVVLSLPPLRRLALACFAFNGLQTVFTSYFVSYLVAIGHGLAAAGMAFSIATFVAVPGRILWGVVGSGWVAPGKVMAWLALGMAASCLAVGLSGAHWPLALVGLAGAGMSLTALSWHGVLLAEAARLAPEGMRGAATGGVLSFGQMGALLLPLGFAAVLGLTGSYALAFLIGAVPALVVGVLMLRGEGREAALTPAP